jgi:adenylylsulfate kinase
MSWAIWITGPGPGGAPVLARAVVAALTSAGISVRLLELDEIRPTLVPVARDTEIERDIVHRALGLMAALLAQGGVRTVVGASAPRRAWRDLAREAIPRFAEVHVTAAADPAYEAPLAPELVVDRMPGPEAVEQVVALARRLEGDAAVATGEGGGWAIWITGRPGSGKTSLAERVALALTSEGAPVRVLDLAAVRRFLLRSDQSSEAEQEIAHRALAHAARHLADAGMAVIVDATAPRRAWRETARALIPRFAEVQLVCSEEMCVERERATRWGLGLHRASPGALRAPEVAPDYEDSPRAELTLRTDTHDLWTTVEQVLFLARRLRRTSLRVEETPDRASR